MKILLPQMEVRNNDLQTHTTCNGTTLSIDEEQSGYEGAAQKGYDSSNDGHQYKEHPKKSQNIALILAYTIFMHTGRSLWSNVMSSFIFLLFENHPEYVGFISGVQGITTVMASFPAGFLADCYRRDTLLQMAALVGLAAVICTCLAVHFQNGPILCTALSLWGAFIGVSNTGLSALFADSILDGQRSHYFTQRMILRNFGNTAGPFMGIMSFYFLGDGWIVQACATVIVLAQLMCFPALLLFFFMSDNHSTKNDCSRTKEKVGAEISNGNNFNPTEASVIVKHHEMKDEKILFPTSSGGKAQSFDKSKPPCCGIPFLGLSKSIFSCLCLPEHRIVPVCVATTDLIGGFAAGMSIKYFPIFFMDNVGLAPTAVLWMYTISPLCQSALAKVALVLSKKMGRPQTTVSFKITGILLTLIMVTGYKWNFSNWVICVIFIFRQSFMNSTSALTKSLLMDSVPKDERGKWSIIESVHTFSWSGSAMLGGILVASIDITFNFYITALLQLIALLPLILLFGRVGIILLFDKVESETGIVASAGKIDKSTLA